MKKYNIDQLQIRNSLTDLSFVTSVIILDILIFSQKLNISKTIKRIKIPKYIINIIELLHEMIPSDTL